VNRQPSQALSLRLAALTLAALATLGLGACGDKKAGSGQVAAKVNKSEISVHQVNFILQRQPGIPADQVAGVSKRVLDGLIDQELMIQQAVEEKLDRDPKVVMAIENARREILSRAYADRLADSAGKPTPEEIKAYYGANPALFGERRIYSLQEFSVEASAEARQAVAPKLQEVRGVAAVEALLKAANLPTAARQINQGAENLPMSLVNQVAKMEAGQSLASATPQGFSVLTLVGSKPAPVSEEQAKPAIEQFLVNERKRKLVEDTLKKQREAAKISYEGQFATAASAAPAAAETAASK
jgi:EpsD family peptidyl-prolyl cis-trans isomerase